MQQNIPFLQTLPMPMDIYYYTGGLEEYVKLLCDTKASLIVPKNTKKKKQIKASDNLEDNHDPIAKMISQDGSTILISGSSQSSTDNKIPPVSIKVALHWSSDMYTESILSFTNNIRTRDGGSHVNGLKTSLKRTLTSLARRTGKLKEGAPSLPGKLLCEGLTAIVSVSVTEPEIEGQTKGRLWNLEVRPTVDSTVARALTTLFDFRPDVLDTIHSKSTAARDAAAAARAARDVVTRKTLLTSTVKRCLLPRTLLQYPSQGLRYRW